MMVKILSEGKTITIKDLRRLFFDSTSAVVHALFDDRSKALVRLKILRESGARLTGSGIGSLVAWQRY
jgi:hypothetical protein